MSRLTPILLFLLVAGLGYLALRQSEREAAEPVDVARPLFEGVELRRVQSIRLENIERSEHVGIKRGPGNAWLLNDPIDWTLAPEITLQILQIIQRSRATLVPEELHEGAVLSLATPRGFLETEELLEDGTTKRTRVEIGKVDIDGIQLYVRSDGKLMRTTRNVESLLGYTLTDLRSKRLFSFRPGEIVEVERIGGWYDDGDSLSLGMHARSAGYAWGIIEPTQVQGDPALFNAWGTYMTSLSASRFVSDGPEPDLEEFGMTNPWLTIRLTGSKGAIQTLHVTQTESGLFARRDALPNIFGLDTVSIPFLCEPVEHFYDLTFARVSRRSVERLYLERPGESLRFSRGVDKNWTVAVAPQSEAGLPVEQDRYSMELNADEDVVADLLNATEIAEIKRYYTDLVPDEIFADKASLRGLWIQPYGEQRRGGVFGPEITNREGVTLTPFLRFGTSLVGTVDPDFSSWAMRPVTDFLNRKLWALENMRLRKLELVAGGATRAFSRADEHDWQPEGISMPARELDSVLDYLIFLTAEEHLAEGDRPQLEDVVTVNFTDVLGTRSSAVIGRTADGEVHARVGVIQAVLKHPALHENLLAVMKQ